MGNKPRPHTPRRNIYVPEDVAAIIDAAGNASGYIADAVRYYEKRVSADDWKDAPTSRIRELISEYMEELSREGFFCPFFGEQKKDHE